MTRVVGIQPEEKPGDIEHHVATMVMEAKFAADQGARLVCFPECFLQGYVVEPAFVERHAIAVDSEVMTQTLARLSSVNAIVVFGFIEQTAHGYYNSAAVVERGRLLGTYRKANLLPGESKVFEPGTDFPVFQLDDITFGINICFDLQFPETASAVTDQGADLLVCPCNNMLRRASAIEWQPRHNEIRALRCQESSVWLLSSDVTGERDGRLALGPTAVINPAGEVVAEAARGRPGSVTYEICTGQ